MSCTCAAWTTKHANRKHQNFYNPCAAFVYLAYPSVWQHRTSVWQQMTPTVPLLQRDGVWGALRLCECQLQQLRLYAGPFSKLRTCQWSSSVRCGADSGDFNSESLLQLPVLTDTRASAR